MKASKRSDRIEIVLTMALWAGTALPVLTMIDHGVRFPLILNGDAAAHVVEGAQVLFAVADMLLCAAAVVRFSGSRSRRD